MGTSRGRPVRGDARRAILVATLRLVAEEGIDAVTHRRVADLAGVSPGSTTHHFASRGELLREAFRHYLREADSTMAALDDALREASDEPLRRVSRFLCELVDREFADERMVRAEYELLLYASGDEVLAADVRVWEARAVAGLAAAMEAARAPRPVEAARTLLNVVRGYELERLLDPQLGADDLRRRLDPLLAGLVGATPRTRTSQD